MHGRILANSVFALIHVADVTSFLSPSPASVRISKLSTKRHSTDENNHNFRSSKTVFSFGVIADVQWADIEDGYNYGRTVKRCYRGAFKTLENAVNWWLSEENQRDQPPAFIAQLGDVIDGINTKLNQSEYALNLALDQLNRLPIPSINLVGNHELYNFDRKYLSLVSWLKHGDKEFYSFLPAQGWKIIVMDPYQIALIGHAKDDPRRQEAVDLIGRENKNVDLENGGGSNWFDGFEKGSYKRRFVPYNGGFGKEQLAWLKEELSKSANNGERVIIFSHVIIHPKACGGGTMVWDFEEALEILNSEEAGGCVVAVMCGHDHKGNYFKDENGVQHCTFSSPLNKGEDGHAYGIVSIKDDNSIEIRGPKIDDLLPNVQGRPSPVSYSSTGVSNYSPQEMINLELRSPLPVKVT